MKNLAESNDVVLPTNLFGPAQRLLGFLFMTERYLATLSSEEVARKAGQAHVSSERAAWLAREEQRTNELFAAAERQAKLRDTEVRAQFARLVGEFHRMYVRRAQPEAAQ
jgi:hypothetical protein